MSYKNQISKVYVDTREQKMIQKTVSFFKGKKIMIEKKALPDGDLVFVLKNHEKIFIERKSFPDFVSSYISNNHIQNQAVRLSQYKYYACIVHGNIFDLRRIDKFKRVSQNSVHKMTANLMLFYKLPIFFVETEQEYLKMALLIAETVIKHDGAQIPHHTLVNNSQERPDIKILMAQDNIGVQKAKILLDAFKTPKAVLNASREELLSIKGIGNAMVANIKELKSIFEDGVKK